MSEAISPSTNVARGVVAELVRLGVSTFILCPGSRSAPLAYALADAEAAGVVSLHVETDERVAGFIALGSAVAGKPAAVVTTSGSAVANLHPAVEEANFAGVPLIVLSADRPNERRGVRASQTADHRAVLEGSVRAVAEIPADAPAVRGQVVRTVWAALHGHPGPVLINVAFREPLMPEGLWPDPVADCAATERRAGSRTVIVSGPSIRSNPLYQEELPDLSGVPILAEPTGELRGHPNALSAHPILLRTALRSKIERVIVLGHPTLTREVSALLADPEIAVYAVDEGAGYTDAAGTADVVTLADVPALISDSPVQWLEKWLALSARADEAIEAELALMPRSGCLPAIARAITESGVPTQLAASTIIREVNLYGRRPAGPLYANRGLAGIDGTMSSAIGCALATGQPTRVVVGDLAFIHDATALVPTIAQRKPRLDVVVIDDRGGSLFAALEYGTGPEDTYDRVFRTEKALDIEAFARAVGAEYRAVSGADDLRAALEEDFSIRIVHVDAGRTPMAVERADRAGLAERILARIEG
ncbi:2-succinyl-5-enolpyruvyl-6-hydroxy-3-cyclohexene-1-carboxylic-acid synthase [Trueperella pecoris]|uniref:2-succinyl-5-enolpyruvyl-6-hydroxy-3-cyclohexene-1-carboxylate synthase n=1 Tax=Trueperella pecoris TaxID=2733571 RepID=A0A7M1R373_9ACTO|nr:2-succinyl-5-enolpyruvyl-6-hydroxy-3-cyclohexene-1-carboxylic-acid synthase [Trueperella pecoris]QOR48144.1 2-succinyl-5-enolpyruvyl-6-hydroxy-3-cyclohexene-1-carboxylic-acid synthase [Trueperella pecoris]